MSKQLGINKPMDNLDERYPIGKDWQQPETEDEFLSRKLPCDIKIGGGVNKAGTSIKTLLLRVNSIIGSQDLVVDKEKQAKAKRMLLNLMNGDNKEDDTDDWQSVDSYQVGVDIASGDDKPVIFDLSKLNNATRTESDKLLKIALGALNQFSDDNDSIRAIKSDIERYLNYYLCDDGCEYHCTENGTIPKKCKQPTLVQKPFQYPCDGALYFTKKDRAQVYVEAGLLSKNNTMQGGIDKVLALSGIFANGIKLRSNQDGKNIEYDGGNYVFGNPDFDLIMFVLE